MLTVFFIQFLHHSVRSFRPSTFILCKNQLPDCNANKKEDTEAKSVMVFMDTSAVDHSKTVAFNHQGW